MRDKVVYGLGAVALAILVWNLYTTARHRRFVE